VRTHMHVCVAVRIEFVCDVLVFVCQICAAKGLIPGQGNVSEHHIVFSRAPSSLAPDGSTGKPLGQCGGWFDPRSRPRGGVWGFATDDIFYLEVCLFHELCKNGKELFQLQSGERYRCDFNESAVQELRRILQTPAEPGPDQQFCGT
jgi:hypothetical protein